MYAVQFLVRNAQAIGSFALAVVAVAYLCGPVLCAGVATIFALWLHYEWREQRREHAQRALSRADAMSASDEARVLDDATAYAPMMASSGTTTTTHRRTTSPSTPSPPEQLSAEQR